MITLAKWIGKLVLMVVFVFIMIVLFVYIPRVLYGTVGADLEVSTQVRLAKRCINAGRTQLKLFSPDAHINWYYVDRLIGKVEVSVNFIVGEDSFTAECEFVDDRTHEQIEKAAEEEMTYQKDDHLLKHMPRWMGRLMIMSGFPAREARLERALAWSDKRLIFEEEVVKGSRHSK